MSHIFPRNHKASLPTAVRAEGCYIYDETGKQYLDATGGAAVSCLGHGDKEVIAQIKDQLDNMAWAHTSFFTSEPAEALADRLIKYAPDGIEKVYFVSGGSEANEAALKLARQYFLDKGEPERAHVIARRQSYHGNTLGALAAGGNAQRRAPFSPLLINMSHIAPCYAYGEMRDDETQDEYGLRVANELEEHIHKVGANKVMAFIAEPVVGATLGAVAAVPGYFKRIREICTQYGVLLILDEVMCGMGRTGTLFASEQEGIAPDIVSIAKGLGGGYQAIGAMLCTNKIYDTIGKGLGFFQHGHTYIGHPVGTRCGLAVLNAIIERDLLTNVQKQGQKIRTLLKSEFAEHPHIGDVRGRGLFIGIELVENRETKTPFAEGTNIPAKLRANGMERGLMVYPNSGTRDGTLGDHILLAPPYIYNDAHVDELMEKLKATIAGAGI